MPRRTRRKHVQRDLWGKTIPEQREQTAGLVALDFETRAVRMIVIKGEPWWVLTDVAFVLKYRDAEQAGRLLRAKHRTTTLSGTSELKAGTILVNEAGLYRLMMRSNKPEAERFQDWITDEILPSIRRTGSYIAHPKNDRIGRQAKRLKSDRAVAKIRCDTVDLNKRTNKRLAAEGACPRDFQVYHNGKYEGHFEGMTASDIRAELKVRGRKTPLDYMGGLPLSQSYHALMLAEKRIEETKSPLSFAEQAEILKETIRDIARKDLLQLGHGYSYGPKDDPERGLVMDVIRLQLADNSN